jgi:hypothetical protein
MHHTASLAKAYFKVEEVFFTERVWRKETVRYRHPPEINKGFNATSADKTVLHLSPL